MTDFIRYINSWIPGPLDGWVVASLVYALSPPEEKMRNTVAVGVAHFALHESICRDEPVGDPIPPNLF